MINKGNEPYPWSLCIGPNQTKDLKKLGEKKRIEKKRKKKEKKKKKKKKPGSIASGQRLQISLIALIPTV